MSELRDHAQAPAGGPGPTRVASADFYEERTAFGTDVVDDGDEIDLVGTNLLGRYSILKRLGQGGMGTVYLAEHTTIRKKFAIKVLGRRYAHKPDLVQRFLQEARAASMITQQNVVEITDFGETPTKSVFFVMEYLDGEDLATTVERENVIAWARARPIILQVCRALQAAHEAGIVHRDMKPENCFRIRRAGNEDFIKVLDFGIAKVTGDNSAKGLTQTGMIFGTPEYMSPEQARGEKADHRVDVYAVGIILYELLTGKVPFTADTFMGILTKHMFEVPKAPHLVAPAGTEIPPEAEAIILKALQKDRSLRFQTMAEMAEALEEVGTGSAAVAVVSETIVLPSMGRMEFSGDFGRVVVKGRRGRIVVIGALVAVGVVVGTAVGLRLSQDAGGRDLAAVAAPDSPPEARITTAADETPVALVEAPPESQVEKQKQIEVGTPTVRLQLQTNVDAKVHDAVDDAVYGLTNTPDGVDLERSEAPLRLILRAEGYEDLEMEIVPNRNKTWNKSLKKLKKKHEKAGARGTEAVDPGEGGADPAHLPEEPKEPGEPKAVDETDPPPEEATPKSPKPNPRNGDLKNPFD